MTQIEVARQRLEAAKADALVLGWFKDDAKPSPLHRAIDARLNGALTKWIELGGFRGKLKEVSTLPTGGGVGAPRVILVGLGPKKEFSLDALREAAARAALTAREAGLATCAMPLVGTEAKGITPLAAGQAIAEGVLLGLFEFKEFKSKKAPDDDPKEPEKILRKVLLVDASQARVAVARRGVQAGVVLAESVNLARRLIMMPSIAKRPRTLAALAAKEARRWGIRVQVLAERELKAKRMGALLGVGAGSVEGPRMVILTHRPKGKKTVLLVGKGITFDSGGINIKPSEGLDRMRYDMAGSATVLAATLAAARLRLPHRVIGILCLAENMPSGSAIRPGDVLTAYDGTTIEVGNTDAEGRLVLADGISYGVATYKPNLVVDVATLTGAIRTALGGITTGILGSEDALVRRLIEAGRRTGDDLWQLPLNRNYEKQIESDVADIKNVGPGGGGAITAAAFLKHFVGKTPWAHLDIAGTCWTEKGPGELRKEYLPKGATGIGVRLLVEFLRALD